MAFNPYLGAAERARIEAARIGVAGAGGWDRTASPIWSAAACAAL